MGLIADVKALLAIKNGINNIKEAYKMNSTNVKPGWQTTEFWGKLAVQVFSIFSAVKGFIPMPTGAIIAGVLEGIYTIGRSFVKAKGGDLPPVPSLQ